VMFFRIPSCVRLFSSKVVIRQSILPRRFTTVFQTLPSLKLVSPEAVKIVNILDTNGIGNVYFLRPNLIQKICGILSNYRFAFIRGSAGLGKSSLVSMFVKSVPEFEFRTITIIENRSGHDIFLDQGIDLGKQVICPTFKSSEKPIVFVIDDSHQKFEDKTFWISLLKDFPAWAPSNIKFLIAGSPPKHSDRDIANLLESVLTLSRDDLLLDFEESILYLRSPFGFCDMLKKFDVLEKVVATDCAGNLAALRISTGILNRFYESNPVDDESVFVRYFYSSHMLNYMVRCFTDGVMTAQNKKVSSFLMKSLFNPQQLRSITPYLKKEEDKEHFWGLISVGLLNLDSNGNVSFASPLAKRFYCKLMRNRAAIYDMPESLFESISTAISYLSPKQLSQSSSVTDDLRGAFFQALMYATPYECKITPELSYFFRGDDFFSISGGYKQIFINGSVRWAINLGVEQSLDKPPYEIFEHVNYSKLGLLDSAHVVFVHSVKEYDISKIKRRQNLVIVIFKEGDFTSCTCFFGLSETPETITLIGS
jgi:hypothetical protein